MGISDRPEWVVSCRPPSPTPDATNAVEQGARADVPKSCAFCAAAQLGRWTAYEGLEVLNGK